MTTSVHYTCIYYMHILYIRYYYAQIVASLTR